MKRQSWSLRVCRNFWSVLVVGVVLILPLTVAAAFSSKRTIPEEPYPPAGYDLLEDATRLMFTREHTQDEIFRLIDEAERRFSEIPDEDIRTYWIARTDLARARRYNQLKDKKSAAKATARGLAQIQGVLEKEQFSEGLRVLADLHAQMMAAKGLFYMIRNGNEARDAAIAALEREPRNIKAQITVAGFLLNAPPMAGGDTEQGILVLERALAQEPASANDRFLILGWLAQASHTLDDMDAAEQYFAEALSIYPDSDWLAEIGDEILE
ncbi:MAG: hypothetical protein WCY01_04210 [Alkalispirochaeta sp.]